MRTTVTLLLLTFIHLVPAFAQPDWEEEEFEMERHRRPDNASRARPKMEFDEKPSRSGKNSQPYILSAAVSAETGIFLNSNMIAEANIAQAPQNESSIAIHPTDPKTLISSAVDSRGAWVYVSRDGGRSWVNKRLGVINTNWQSGNDPSVGFDHLGNGYVMFGAFPSGTYTGESGVYVCKTFDKGETWTAPMIVIEHRGTMTADSAFEDKYYIEADNSETSPYRGNLYTPWKRVTDRDSATQIVVTRSTDGGSTWAVPIPVSPRKPRTSTDTTFGQSFPITTTGPDGTLYVAWNDGPIRSIGLVKSTDGGLSFSAPSYPVQGYPTLGTARTVGGPDNRSTYHVLKGTFRAETYPTMMADNSNSPRRGWLYLAWAAGLTPDIHFSRSTDKGETWSTPKVIQSETVNDQWWPWLSIDETSGDIAVMYSDSRNDPANITIDAYVSYSSDGGDTWIDRRATDAVSDFRKNPFQDQIFAGDYSGNAFHAGRIYPSFLDTRNDNDVYTAVMSIFQPYPVENLKVRSLFEEPTSATLTWINPAMVSVFGKPISDYTLVIYRDGAFVATRPAGTVEFSQTGLTINTAYKYEVRVAVGEDTSAVRSVIFTAGESRLPLRPEIAEVHGFRPNVGFDLRIPAVRADSTTPLGNIAAYRLYRDGVLIREEPLSAADTGSIREVRDNPSERGYYRYNFTVVDGATPPNESRATDTIIVYAGSLDPYTETMDGTAPRFYTTGTWSRTTEAALSAPNSYTDRPNQQYPSRSNTFLQIFPVTADGSIDLTFSHIALIDPSDTGYVEVSYDSGTTWRTLATFDSTASPEWESPPDPADWRLERIRLVDPEPGTAGTVAIVRFRLKSGDFRSAMGWFVDDISLGFPSSAPVVGDDGTGHAVRPNPFTEATILEFQLDLRSPVTVRVFDLVGREVRSYDLGDLESGRHATTIDGTGLAPGAYFYEISSVHGISRGRMLLSR